MPASKFLSGIDLVGQQILNALLEVVAGDKGSPANGQVWYNSSTNKFRGRANGANVTFVNDGGDLSAGSVANTALATNPLARANHTGTQTASTISDLAAVVQAYRLDQFAVPTTSLNVNSQRIINVATPTSGNDAANKTYVDNAVAGLSWKDEVRVATTAAGTLASSFANGSVIDGVTLVTGDRILIKDQAAPAENGIYTVAASGAPTRATDADTEAEIRGAAVYVTNGTSNAGNRYVNNNTGTITIGTTAITFVLFAGGISYTAGAGLTLSSTTFAVGAGTGITVNADDVAINPAVVTRHHKQSIGDGTTNPITVTHNLNTQSVDVRVLDAATNELIGDVYAVANGVNTVQLTFGVIPTTNQYRVVVLG